MYDSDFHTTSANRLGVREYLRERVVIGANVLIGNNVIILKGSAVGDNSVVAAEAVVTKKFGPNVIVAGIPARVIGPVPQL